ncbi:hypothetical protein EJ03DRAFT_182767 [Teratosphaeria nubilosa]|uniref:Uncharacterized protein n=1 Tax=Teratosphaeria nubilosa TaxID=161662 RepID=A0A6G1L045_9PEZI|nr:hypothetical protein EJ03DRAFT_182767 [Teratosphaeria nubilosa]
MCRSRKAPSPFGRAAHVDCVSPPTTGSADCSDCRDNSTSRAGLLHVSIPPTLTRCVATEALTTGAEPCITPIEAFQSLRLISFLQNTSSCTTKPVCSSNTSMSIQTEAGAVSSCQNRRCIAFAVSSCSTICGRLLLTSSEQTTMSPCGRQHAHISQKTKSTLTSKRRKSKRRAGVGRYFLSASYCLGGLYDLYSGYACTNSAGKEEAAAPMTDSKRPSKRLIRLLQGCSCHSRRRTTSLPIQASQTPRFPLRWIVSRESDAHDASKNYPLAMSSSSS